MRGDLRGKEPGTPTLLGTLTLALQRQPFISSPPSPCGGLCTSPWCGGGSSARVPGHDLVLCASLGVPELPLHSKAQWPSTTAAAGHAAERAGFSTQRAKCLLPVPRADGQRDTSPKGLRLGLTGCPPTLPGPGRLTAEKPAACPFAPGWNRAQCSDTAGPREEACVLSLPSSLQICCAWRLDWSSRVSHLELSALLPHVLRNSLLKYFHRHPVTDAPACRI